MPGIRSSTHVDQCPGAEKRGVGRVALGPYWSTSNRKARTHVEFYIDNTSAVAWSISRASRNPVAQMYNRLFSLAEFRYNVVFTASHIAGKLNVMADGGSRSLSTITRPYVKDAASKHLGTVYLYHLQPLLELMVSIRQADEMV
ncbi:hypothetical protein PHMEG_0009255 [Phytophthora megakarya]|uniref:Uncharacterized protein n=1 Tax=Phytophthora megakarya TaxID=4795 RepID=A0A225WGZ4_9STRA|nr:hypothetical protein PHMEG_0009255 [Phytophthora megakarya]